MDSSEAPDPTTGAGDKQLAINEPVNEPAKKLWAFG